MKKTTLLAALVLAMAPTLAAASCPHGEHAQTTSCQAGSAWDAATGTCVTNPLG